MERVFEIGLGLTNLASLASWAWQWEAEIGERGVTKAAPLVSRLRQVMLPSRVLDAGWQHLSGRAELGHAAPAEDASLKARARRAASNLTAIAGTYKRALGRFPSLFFVTGASDRTIKVSLVVAALCGVACVLGVGPTWAAALAFAAIYASYCPIGDPWLSLQFESLLVELNVLYGVGAAFAWAAPTAWVIAQRWLLFRLMVAAGAGKLASGDDAWRNGTAMAAHYESQPLPNALSRFMHRLPPSWHKVETYATFFFEGPLALAYWSALPALRWVSTLLTFGFNATIGATGNYGHLHVACIVCSLAVITDSTACVDASKAGVLATLKGLSFSSLPAVSCPAAYSATSASGVAAAAASVLAQPMSLHATPWALASAAGAAAWYLLSWAGWAAAWAAVGLYIATSLVPFVDNFDGLVEVSLPRPRWWDTLEDWAARAGQWHVVGRYNLFATMTWHRYELQLEGTADGGRTWYAYRYPNKPGGPPVSLNDAPKTLPVGYFNRSDWRQWFIGLQVHRLVEHGVDPLYYYADLGGRGRARGRGDISWYTTLVREVLVGNPVVTRGLVVTPQELVGKRLDALRTLVYEYRFSDGRVRVPQPAPAPETTAAAASKASEAATAPPSPSPGDAGEGEEASSPSPSRASGGEVRRRATSSGPPRADAASVMPPGQPSGQVGAASATKADAPPPSLASLLRSLPEPDGSWEEGYVWKRRLLCTMDVQVRPAPAAPAAATSNN